MTAPPSPTQSQSQVASQQQGGLRLSGPPSGQGAGGWARTRDRKFPGDLRADSLTTVPWTLNLSRMLLRYDHITVPNEESSSLYSKISGSHATSHPIPHHLLETRSL
ncbi:hypothetical protein PoB_002634700 [Plakobranchus ocellatus]|uniref:Uncharacterized protein n=1 Tax=Plakobranchus ocellatus TaxID=259542 RepID=A0AAV3ZXN8_9GAST|nr:hypothetical protein PoB_002634700 [Plakobranchus ocellatus]